MGQTTPPQPVKLIVGMLSKNQELFARVEDEMRTLWGNTDVCSEVMPFTHTNYYQKKMGSPLWRKFIAFVELIDPGWLARIKRQSNELEDQYAKNNKYQEPGVLRPINLDPGYIDMSKLVLATTKNYSHRIYIGDSMYAEATLHYHKGAWQSWPYTYPDYACGDYSDFFNRVRERLMDQLG
ncbi:MAG: DUF4416 family protein [Sedimentisphaerales bacterium]|nr:DUF4416 family protein [Sedimentisphaerales bacterium]